MNKELEDFKKNLEQQQKRVEEKINPILRLYDENKINRKELVEKLAEAFYELEEEEDSKIK